VSIPCASQKIDDPVEKLAFKNPYIHLLIELLKVSTMVMRAGELAKAQGRTIVKKRFSSISFLALPFFEYVWLNREN
jgi:hypothetical protein